jgi:hypothetical protein
VPAHRKHEPPFDGLRRVLSECRAAGMPFEAAWHMALGAPASPAKGVRLPHATAHRHAWLDVFESTKGAWEAAYTGRETPLSRVLAHLAERVIEDASAAARIGHLEGAEQEAHMALLPLPLGISGFARKGLKRGGAQDWPETRELGELAA